MRVLYETERLIAREWTEDDAKAAFSMYSDPDVTRFLGTGAVETTIDAQREKLRANIQKYKDMNNGQGFWALIEKSSGEIVGSTLLKPLPDSDKVEIGWHLRKSAWGKGYATEASLATLRYGFEVLGLDEIYAVAYSENSRSLRVAAKIGMTHIGLQRYYGRMLETFVKKR
jgi:RimJ/RimL family protein N-acetyltransferase